MPIKLNYNIGFPTKPEKRRRFGVAVIKTQKKKKNE